MAHPCRRQPAWAPIAWCVAVVAPLLAIVLALLPWIPSWGGPMKVVSIAVSLVGVTAVLASTVARIRSASSVSRRGKVALGLACVGQLLTVALVCLNLIEIFPPEYAYSINTRGARAYVYNNGFLEREVAVLVQLEPIPIHVPLNNAPRCHTLEVELDRDGYTLLVCGRRCDVRTRYWEVGKP